MRATIRDVSCASGFSETTVSLAFRSGSRISDATREKVLRVAQKLNYMPNQMARSLRHGRPRVLAIMVNNIINPFYARMIRTAEATAMSKGYQMMVMESQWNPVREVEIVNHMLQARVQGAIICLSELTDESLPLFNRYNVPYIALDTFPLDYNGPYVANDMVAAGQLSAEHLLEIGCRNPVLVFPERPQRQFSSFARLRLGFTKVMDSGKIPFGQSQVFNAGLTIEDGLEIFPQILASQPKVDGILCGNDLCALGVMEAMENSGIKAGRDIAVMGIDDLPVSRLAKISLTSIQQPYELISKHATEAIIEGLEKKKPIALQQTLLPALIKRNSTLLNRK